MPYNLPGNTRGVVNLMDIEPGGHKARPYKNAIILWFIHKIYHS